MFTGTVKAKVTRNNFRELTKQGRKAAARRNREIAELAVDIARQLAPVDKGELRDSIHVETNPRTGSASAVASAPHAQFVELGTVNSAAQPFLRPAAELAAKRSRNRRMNLFRG